MNLNYQAPSLRQSKPPKGDKTVLEAELSQLRKDIAASRQYLRAQEKQVNDAIAEWNALLTDFYHEAERLNEEKAKLAADIIRLRQQRAALSVASPPDACV